MGPVRPCVCLLVILVHLQVISSKPFLWDWFYEEDDDSTSESDTPDFFDMLFGYDSPSSAPTTSPKPSQSIIVRAPPVSLNMTQYSNGILQLILDAMSGQTTAAPGSAATTAATTTTVAPAGNATNSTA